MRTKAFSILLLLLAVVLAAATKSSTIEPHDILHLFQQMSNTEAVEEDAVRALDAVDATCRTNYLPNVKLGFGYDVIKSDPGFSVNTNDPGLKTSAVLQLEYGTDSTGICEQNFRVPLKTTYSIGNSCSEEQVLLKTAGDYKKMISSKVQVDGPTIGFEFSAAPGYKYNSERVTKFSQVNIYKNSMCQAYHVAYKDFTTNAPKVTSAFQKAVVGLNSLGTTVELLKNSFMTQDGRSKMLALYQTFGTSVIVAASHGRKTSTRLTIGRKLYSMLLADGFDPVNTNRDTLLERIIFRQLTVSYDPINENTGSTFLGADTAFTYGSNIFDPMGVETPMPLPFKMTVKPITEFMTTQYISGIAADRLAAIKHSYEQFTQLVLCSLVPGCSFHRGTDQPALTPSIPYRVWTSDKIGGDGGYTVRETSRSDFATIQCRYIDNGPVEQIIIGYSDGTQEILGNPDSSQPKYTIKFEIKEPIMHVKYSIGSYNNADTIMEIAFYTYHDIFFCNSNVWTTKIQRRGKVTEMYPYENNKVVGLWTKAGWHLDQFKVKYVNIYADAPVEEPLGISWSNDVRSDGNGYAEPSIDAIGNLCFLSGTIKSSQGQLVDVPLASVSQYCASSNARMRFKSPHMNSEAALDLLQNRQLQYTNLIPGDATEETLSRISLSGIIYPKGDLVDLAMENGWRRYHNEVFGKPAVTVQNGLCVLSGLAEGTFQGSAVKIATLPSNCRPKARLVFAVVQNGILGRIDLLPAGDVILSNDNGRSSIPSDVPTWVSLTGVQFSIEPQYTGVEFLNSWINYGGSWHSVSANVIDGYCVVNGLIKNGRYNAALVRLPPNCRPTATHRFLVANVPFVSHVEVSPIGEVSHVAGDNSNFWISLSGIVFPVV